MTRTSWLLVGAGAVWLAACGSMSSTPSAPTPAPSATPAPPTPAASTPAPGPVPASGLLVGTWTGTGSDSFSPELVRLLVTQSDQRISGVAQLDPVNASDGSCGSCHKLRRGTLTGAIVGNAVSIEMRFPPGGDVPTPICDTTFSATATVANGRLTGTYTGTDSCEGTYTNGVLDLTRQ